MEPEWSSVSIVQIKNNVLPALIKCYFGSDLDLIPSGDDFIFCNPPKEHESERLIVKWWDGTGNINDEIGNLNHVLQQEGVLFGLLVTLFSKPFQTWKLNNNRIVSLFGKQQLNAIARLNYYQLLNKLPYRYRFPFISSIDGAGASYLGQRYVVWADVVEFVQQTVNVSNRIGVDPILIRRLVITLVDHALSSTKKRKRVKVGSDGWYFAYVNQQDAVDDAIQGYQNSARYVNSVFGNTKLRLICSLTYSPAAYVDEGGPIDDGSILAYKVLAHHSSGHQHSDIRIVEHTQYGLNLSSTGSTGWKRCCSISLTYFGNVDIWYPP